METIFNRRPVISLNIMDNFDYASQHELDLPNLMEILPSPPESESQDSDNRYCDLSSPEAMGFSNYRKDEPLLVITEQPVEKFRFRYKSEMAGTHGCLNGKNSDKSVKVTYPTVELRNYSKPAIVRCSLYTAPTKDGHEQFPHPHRLMREDDPDPHDIEVGPDLGFEAVFSNMGIIHTARKFINDELTKKKIRMYREKRRLGPKQELKTHDKVAIKNEIEEETKRINLNTVTLCFEAFERRPDGSLYSICDKVFSDPINNSKSAMTGELKICRMDKAVSPCSGGEEIFMFVEKVVKKNIEVRFFEINNETEEITWTGKGIFNDLDVHHQYAIALRTPPYRDQNINKQVLVYVELFRPSDGDRSEPRAFRYKPNEKSGVGKKRRFNDEIIPTTIESGDLSGNLLDGKDCVQAIEEFSNGVNSSEFQKFLDIFENDLPEYSGALTSSSTELTPDGDLRRRYTDNLMSKKIPKIYKLRGGYKEVKETNEVYNQLIDSLKDTVIESNPKLKKNTQSILKCKLNSTGDKYIDEEKEIKEIEKNAYKKVIIRLKDAMKANHPNLKNLVLTVFKLRLDPTGDNVLSMAIKMNLENDVYYLIQLLEEVDDGFLVNFANNVGETALHRAAELGKENIVRSLMKINANPNCPDAKGDTVFHTALKSQHNAAKTYDIVKMLCNYNSLDFDLENDDGLTAVHLAVRSNNLAVTKLLIEKGADVNHISSHDGDSALHMAVTNNNIDIVKYLLEFSKININQQNFGGYTALHKAVAQENADICKILRVYNADPNIPNNDMCVEIKQENDEDEEDEEDPEGGITSVQLALHNKYLLDILKQEPQMYFHEDDDIKMEIKEEEIEMVETKPDVLYTEDLAVICDGSDLWEKLAEFFGCQDFVDVFRNTSSPTRAIINYKKVDVTLDVVRQFQAFLADPVEGSKLDEIIGRLTI